MSKYRVEVETRSGKSTYFVWKINGLFSGTIVKTGFGFDTATAAAEAGMAVKKDLEQAQEILRK